MRATSMALRFSITSIRVKPWRIKHIMPTQPSRSLSILCRGEPISREDLFKYTLGRFLVGEKEKLEERYLKFDLDQLCAIAASTGSKSPVHTIQKMEGGFSKALLMTKEDGSELVAKLPFSIAGPPKYLTASEAAVLQYLHDHTKVPVPKLLAWNADASNPVGAEYIIMEKAAGCQLARKWEEMKEDAPLEFIKNLCRLEGELAAISFPANGSLYLQESMDDGEKYETLAPEMDPSGRFCIGPSCQPAWFNEGDTESIQAHFDRGPWPTLPAFGIALAEREIARIEQNPKPAESHGPPRGSIEEQLAVLEMAKTVFSRLDSEPHAGDLAWPTLWHTDLHAGNIYVSDDDPTQIASIIDWQSIVVAPMFFQVGFPALIDIDEDYTFGNEVPTLPEDFDQMDEDDQVLAKYKHKEAVLAKVYEYGCGLKNWDIYRAIGTPPVYRNLFRHCGKTWEQGPVPLYGCLLVLAEAWSGMGFSGDCPLKFSEDDIKKHEQQYEEWCYYQRTHKTAQELLNTDSDGWIPPHADFEKKQKQNEELLDMFIASSAKHGKSEEWARKRWPY